MSDLLLKPTTYRHSPGSPVVDCLARKRNAHCECTDHELFRVNGPSIPVLFGEGGTSRPPSMVDFHPIPANICSTHSCMCSGVAHHAHPSLLEWPLLELRLHQQNRVIMIRRISMTWRHSSTVGPKPRTSQVSGYLEPVS